MQHSSTLGNVSLAFEFESSGLVLCFHIYDQCQGPCDCGSLHAFPCPVSLWVAIKNLFLASFLWEAQLPWR